MVFTSSLIVIIIIIIIGTVIIKTIIVSFYFILGFISENLPLILSKSPRGFLHH